MRSQHKPIDFERLARESMDALYSRAIRLTHSTPVAEQVVQMTFQEAHKRFASFNKNASFREWIFQILDRQLASAA